MEGDDTSGELLQRAAAAAVEDRLTRALEAERAERQAELGALRRLLERQEGVIAELAGAGGAAEARRGAAEEERRGILSGLAAVHDDVEALRATVRSLAVKPAEQERQLELECPPQRTEDDVLSASVRALQTELAKHMAHWDAEGSELRERLLRLEASVQEQARLVVEEGLRREELQEICKSMPASIGLSPEATATIVDSLRKEMVAQRDELHAFLRSEASALRVEIEALRRSQPDHASIKDSMLPELKKLEDGLKRDHQVVMFKAIEVERVEQSKLLMEAREAFAKLVESGSSTEDVQRVNQLAVDFRRLEQEHNAGNANLKIMEEALARVTATAERAQQVAQGALAACQSAEVKATEDSARFSDDLKRIEQQHESESIHLKLVEAKLTETTAAVKRAHQVAQEAFAASESVEAKASQEDARLAADLRRLEQEHETESAHLKTVEETLAQTTATAEKAKVAAQEAKDRSGSAEAKAYHDMSALDEDRRNHDERLDVLERHFRILQHDAGVMDQGIEEVKAETHRLGRELATKAATERSLEEVKAELRRIEQELSLKIVTTVDTRNASTGDFASSLHDIREELKAVERALQAEAERRAASDRELMDRALADVKTEMRRLEQELSAKAASERGLEEVRTELHRLEQELSLKVASAVDARSVSAGDLAANLHDIREELKAVERALQTECERRASCDREVQQDAARQLGMEREARVKAIRDILEAWQAWQGRNSSHGPVAPDPDEASIAAIAGAAEVSPRGVASYAGTNEARRASGFMSFLGLGSNSHSSATA